MSAAEATVILHKHRPVTDHHLRLYWKPVYIEEGQEVLGSGANPSKETVPVTRVLFPVRMHDGMLAHAAARQLDQSNYRYEHENLGSAITSTSEPQCLRSRRTTKAYVVW